MRIANITFNNAQGGLEQAFIDYTRILQSQGHEVFSIVCNDAGFLPELRKITDKIIGMRFLRTRYLKFMLSCEFKKIFKDIKPDMVIYHNERNIDVARKVLGKLPLVAVNHGGKIRHMLLAEHIFAVNGRMRDELMSRGYDAANITVIGNMIEV